MTELSIEQIDMPTADIGDVNPLPPLFAGGNVSKAADLTDASADMRANAGYGRVGSICPYLLQDGYGRDRRRRSHRVAVLENQQLRATFLLDAGGRLWSLLHKPSGRDLLFVNPIFQPANLALRNAWLAGGVEWNIGTIGHTPLTCEPMHAARVIDDDGTPVLRLYEFERLRRVVYQIDAHLPPGSAELFVHVRIVNPNREEVPMYWWSNMAVPETPQTRVLAPTDRAWSYSYDTVLRHQSVADGHGGDVSYPARADRAADYFFDLQQHPQPWIAAVDGSGVGVFQTSSANLNGRKLFHWGTGPGGRRWQEWLTGSPEGYAEIQAGLARTQFEHLRMPGGATWSWTEAYGRIELPADAAHAPWPQARTAAEDALTAVVPAHRLSQRHDAATRVADRAPDAVLHTGSGWAALDRRIRARAGEPALDAPGTPFSDESAGAEQAPWITLLDTGTFPSPEPGEFPPSLQLHPTVVDLLAASSGWTAPAVVGVARACAGDLAGARAAWQQSLDRTENAYSRRNLAVVALNQGDAATAVRHFERALDVAGGRAQPELVEPLRAVGSAGSHPALVAEVLRALIAAGDADRALRLIDGLPVDQRCRGRIRMLEATAALRAGDLQRCGAILEDTDLAVADLREGEDSLDQLWWDYRTRLAGARTGRAPDAALRAETEAADPVPAHLDFRMRPATRAAGPI
jgi:hypothetical protein